MTRVTQLVVCLSAVCLVGAFAKTSSVPLRAEPRVQLDRGPRVSCGTQPCDSVARGSHVFRDRVLPGLGGNGRSCADCHMPSDNFQLSPASVEARFQRLMQRQLEDPTADDPLFRPVDADDFRTNGQSASDYRNLRENGLIRVSFPLPANITLVDPATGTLSNETTVDVWRMVPTVNDVKITGNDGVNPWFRGPNPTGGYQLDARFETLQEQALNALIAHAEVQAMPSQQLLDDLAAFQATLFTNPRGGESSPTRSTRARIRCQIRIRR